MISFQDEEAILETRNIVDIFQKIFSYYLPRISPNVSVDCAADLFAIQKAFRHPETLPTENRWALRLVDSWGKSADGILEGNRKLLGNFDECLSVKIQKSATDLGRYCIMKYGAASAGGQTRTPVVSPPIFGTPIIPFYSTCIPSSCTTEELMNSVESSMAEDGFELFETDCQSLADDVTLDGSEIFGIIFFTIFAFLMISASIVDVLLKVLRKNREGGVLPYLLAFSIPGNMRRIFRVSIEPRPGEISCIHGIRFLSITWVISGHQTLYSLYTSANPYYVRKLSRLFLVQIFTNGDKSVDTFFVMSGLLVSYTVLKYVKSPKDFPFISYYIHRIIRLAPPIAVAVTFFATLAGLCITGPFALRYKDVMVEGCRQFWWLDWSFGSNLVFRFGISMTERTGESFACIPQCWYVAVDTQLYILMPLILLPILAWRKIGYYSLVFWTAASVIIPATIIGLNDLYPTSMLSLNVERTMDFTYLIYLMPYCRATPYLIGIGTGILLRNRHNKTVILPYITVAVGWISATIVALYVVFGVYPFNYFAIDNPADDISLGYSIFYGSLHRGLWGACVAWVIVACHWGYGGMVNSFLSHPSFQPLSRLTFCIYIVSLPTQFIILYSTKRLVYYDQLTVLMESCGVLFIAGLGGLFLALTSEFPTGNILKLITSRSQSGRTSEPEKSSSNVENQAKENA